MTQHPRLPEAARPDGSRPSGAEPAYSVGYGRPPRHTQFKAGQSGNPNGRPKRQRNVRTVVEETLSQRIKVREGNRTRSLSKLDGVVLKVVAGALNGDPKALASLFALLRAVGMTAEAPAATHREPFTDNDEAVIADYLQRNEDQAELAKPARNESLATAEAKPPSGRATS